MQVNVTRVFMKTCFTLFVLYATLRDNDGGWGPVRAPTKPGATRSFLLVMLRTIRLDASGSHGTFCWPVSGVFVSVADYICGNVTMDCHLVSINYG